MRGKNATFLVGAVATVTIVLLLVVIGGPLVEGQQSTAQAAEDPVFVGAGDIARCGSKGDEATAALLDGIDGTVFTLGDNAQGIGTEAEFRDCYDPTWGRHKARTMPAVGNHEYETPGAGPYFDYFGAVAGDPDKGYYSYDLGDWHVVVLNSNCGEIRGGCEPDSPQVQWLRKDLESNPSTCTAAYFHHPRFSSGNNGEALSTSPFWEALYAAGTDVVLSGHNHSYERFAPQDPSGTADPKRGIRQFVVGTGGGILREFIDTKPNSQVQITDTFGVLKMTLHPESYDWEFITAPDGSTADSGTASCSGASSTPPSSDDTAPTVKPPRQDLTTDSTPGPGGIPTELGWSATDDESGVASYQLQQSVDGGAFEGVGSSGGNATSKTLQLQPGVEYRFRVRAIDRAGNVSDWAAGSTFSLDAQQESSPSVTYAGAWAEQVATRFYGGTRSYADDGGSTASFTFEGSRGVSWVSSKGLNRGLVEVRLDGDLIETINLYSETWQPREVVFAKNNLDPSVSHTLEVRVLGTKDGAASGTRAHVDAFVTMQ